MIKNKSLLSGGCDLIKGHCCFVFFWCLYRQILQVKKKRFHLCFGGCSAVRNQPLRYLNFSFLQTLNYIKFEIIFQVFQLTPQAVSFGCFIGNAEGDSKDIVHKIQKVVHSNVAVDHVHLFFQPFQLL